MVPNSTTVVGRVTSVFVLIKTLDLKSLAMNFLSRHSIMHCDGKFFRLPYMLYPKGPATKF